LGVSQLATGGAPILDARRQPSFGGTSRAFIDDPRPIRQAAPISFKDMFLAVEGEDEQSSSLATVLTRCLDRFGRTFKAAEVAEYAGRAETDAIAFLGALEHAYGRPLKIVSSTTVTWALKSLRDAPVDCGDKLKIRVLRYHPAAANGGSFSVEEPRAKAV
jgi:hypothetical protein